MFRLLLILLTGLASLVAAYAFTVAPRWLRVSRLRIRVLGLPDELTGTRVAHLSDFHIGARGMSLDHLQQAKEAALSFRPDIIALTGDYYDSGKVGTSDGLFRDWPDDALVLGVMGNHDRRGAPGVLDQIRDELRAAGVTVLDNQAVQVKVRGRTVWIAGVDDPHTFQADVRRALACVPDGEQVLLFLSHTPAAVRDLPPGRANVMLAGHTHGGQVRLLPSGEVPFVSLIRKVLGATPRPDGPVHRRWHWLNGTVLVLSDGLGVSTIPVRFRTRPHLILLELEPVPAASVYACDDVRRYVTEIEPENRLLAWLT